MRARLTLALLLALTPAGAAYAVWPMPPYSAYPCATETVNCQNQGGSTYLHAQSKATERSINYSCTPASDPFGGYCFGGSCTNGFCRQPSFPTTPVARNILTSDGWGVEFVVEYDFPNNYCQLDPRSDFSSSYWPVVYNDEQLTRLQILNSAGTAVIAESLPVFEHGIWRPILFGSCPTSTTYKVRLQTRCNPELSVTQTVQVPAPVELSCQSTVNGCPSNPGGPGTPASPFQSPQSGRPINVGSGDVTYDEPLFTIGQPPLSLGFTLHYHSAYYANQHLVPSPLGRGWLHPFMQVVKPVDLGAHDLYHLTPSGEEHLYKLSSVYWNAVRPGDLRGQITQVGSEYRLKDLDGTVAAFDVATGRWLSTTDRWNNQILGTYAAGELTKITDSMGREITLNYTSGKIASIVFDGKTWSFDYTGTALTSIFDPLHSGATAWHTYTYANDSLGVARLLTGVLDDAGKLLEGHTYDSLGRGLTSFCESDREKMTIQYDVPAAGKRTVTHEIDATTNQVSVFTLLYQSGRYLPTEVIGNCATCGAAGSDSQSYTYNASNLLLTRTDGSSHVTEYTYNSNGMILTRTDAKNTANERVTTYFYEYAAWPAFATKIDQPSAAKPSSHKITTLTWNSSGTPETTLTTVESGYLKATDTTATTLTATRTFDSRHRLLTVDGPRTDKVDVTTNAYYPDNDAATSRRGRLKQVTDAAGLVTTYDDYDIFGTARSVTDPNGAETESVTDGRGRITTMTSKAVAGDANETTDYVTAYAFDSRDRLASITYPRGNKVAFGYSDGTNWLTDTIHVGTDSLQYERRHLTLNTIGGKKSEEDQSCDTPAVTCAAWTTRRTESYTYDTHNRLQSVDHPVPSGSKIIYTYDSDGRVKTVQDENHASANTTYAYDALDRLQSVTQTLAAGTAVTSYTYDVHDNLATVTDPNGNVTDYDFDDFGRLQQQVSPVTGTTAYAYDPAGNLLSATDANNATTTRTYDEANRIKTAESTRSGSTTETVTWTYDDAVATRYGKGRFASMTDPSGSSTYAYDRRGLLREQKQTIEEMVYTSSYAYDANGNRKQLRYPTGLVVDYTFDFADRTASARSPFATYVGSVKREPFGPLTEVRYGNGTIATRSYDARYRMLTNKLTLAGAITLADYAYTYDTAGNITQIADGLSSTYTRTFTYDDLNRLLTAVAPGLWGNGSYTYDAMGNLTTSSFRSATFNLLNPTPKLQSVVENSVMRNVTYDSAGNETAVGASAFTYSARSSLASGDNFQYTYDGRGLRTITTGASSTRRYFLYTPELQLLAESSYTPIPYRRIQYQYIWFDGVPVAQLDYPGTLRANVRWTLPDHLGTPILLTDQTGNAWWQAEHEPYGTVYQLRTPPRHQPLRLPGQEAEQLTTNNANGDTERSYNVFRWYRAGWGRYTQADPYGAENSINLFAYAGDRPMTWIDPYGLYSVEKFSNPDAQQINEAVAKLYRNLSKPTCGACTENLGDALKKMIENADFVIEYDPTLKDCGWTNPAWLLKPVIKIGPKAFNMTKCGPCLASTILHEISHLYGTHDFSSDWFGGTNSAPALEKRCAAAGVCK